MDPVMQYLNGTYQQAPQFDINQLYERTAPTFMSAAALGDSSPHAIAAARIKSGQAPWELWRDKNLQQQSGMTLKSGNRLLTIWLVNNRLLRRQCLTRVCNKMYFRRLECMVRMLLILM
jgi:hypothetical protein